jgi:hypothetical protein
MVDKITWANETRRLGDLVAWDINPRTINEKEARRLNESLDEFAQVETIAVGPNNEIYNGHQRLKTWIAECGNDYVVDVRVASRALSEDERKKLTVYLHKGAAGEWDFDLLSESFELDNLIDWGFDAKELDFAEPLDIDMQEDFKEVGDIHKCPKCGFEFTDE